MRNSRDGTAVPNAAHRFGFAGRHVLAGVLACVCLSSVAQAQAGSGVCGSIQRSDGGPWDHQVDKERLRTVEAFHFTPEVETLLRGTSGPIAADLDFTLRSFPNHHRALMAMMLYGEKVKSPHPIGATYSVECYFDRAIRFRPQDTIVRMIFAKFLSKSGRAPQAQQQLELATTLAGDNGFTHYNIGLIYFDMKKYSEALSAAHASYALGFTRPDLRERLRGVGKWQDAQANPSAATSNAEPNAATPAATAASAPAATPAANPASQAN